MNKIVIASVLKPVNDPRAFDKLGLSLRETNKYHLNIIGFFAKNVINFKNVVFTSILNTGRLHPKRLLASKNFLSELKAYRPDLVVVTTYELLPAAIWGKKRYNYKLVYDIQENYSFNILDHKTLPFGLRHLVAKLVRSIEKRAAPYIDHFILAEQSYTHELTFLGDYTVLQNKYKGPLNSVLPYRLDHKDKYHFIISGTITPSYGIAEAMDWFRIISHNFPGSQLTIIGHVTLYSFKQKLEKKALTIDGVLLNISPVPIASSEILSAIKRADIILLPYRQKASVKYKIPTKLFESLAMGKPVIHSKNTLWSQMVDSYPAGSAINFEDLSKALEDFKNFLALTFYKFPPSPELTWEDEKSQWIALVDKLLK